MRPISTPLVPLTEWDLPQMSRSEAEALLAGKPKGTSMFRLGSQGGIVLSVSLGQGVRHSTIEGTADMGFTFTKDGMHHGPFATLADVSECLVSVGAILAHS